MRNKQGMSSQGTLYKTKKNGYIFKKDLYWKSQSLQLNIFRILIYKSQIKVSVLSLKHDVEISLSFSRHLLSC